MLEALVRVHETGSFTKAAEDLGISQPNVTRLIKELETLLGVELIHRTTRELATTAVGAKVVEDAIRITDGWERMLEVHGIEGSAGRTIRVFAPIGLGQDHLFDLIAAFQARHETLRFEWFLENGPITFHGKGADLWICQGPVLDDSLVARPVGRMRTVLVSCPTEEARRAVGDIDEIGNLEVISLHPNDRGGLPVTCPDGSPRTLRSPTRLVTNNFPSMYRAVRLGLGYAAMPLWSVSADLSGNRLLNLLPDHELEPIPVSLVYSPRRFRSPALAEFTDYMREEIAKIEGMI